MVNKRRCNDFIYASLSLLIILLSEYYFVPIRKIKLCYWNLDLKWRSRTQWSQRSRPVVQKWLTISLTLTLNLTLKLTLTLTKWCTVNNRCTAKQPLRSFKCTCHRWSCVVVRCCAWSCAAAESLSLALTAALSLRSTTCSLTTQSESLPKTAVECH